MDGVTVGIETITLRNSHEDGHWLEEQLPLVRAALTVLADAAAQAGVGFLAPS